VEGTALAEKPFLEVPRKSVFNCLVLLDVKGLAGHQVKVHRHNNLFKIKFY
jgi:hypothetical protein